MPTIKVASYGDQVDTTDKETSSPKERLIEIIAWSEFTQHTSLHGIKHAFDGRNKLRRTLWLVGVIFMASFLTYTISNLVMNYYEYPTRTEVDYASVHANIYPQVTICSISPLSAAKLVNASTPAIQTLFAAMSPVNWRMENINFSNPNYKFAREQQTKENYIAISNNMSTLLTHCTFEGTYRGSCDNVFEHRMTDMGLCFTTRQLDHGDRVTKMTGSQRGLQISLVVNQADYVFNHDMASGFKVMLHQEGTEPDIVNKGFLVTPGFTTYASTTVVNYKYLPFPYKAFGTTYCLDTKNGAFQNPLTTEDVYDETVCFQECRVKFFMEKCGCVEYTDRGNETICTLEEVYNCLQFAILLFNKGKEEICVCDKPCESTQFNVKLSTAVYPSDLNLKYIEGMYPGWKWENNYAELRIFFENLVETRVYQSAIYSFDSILATLGGQMGIFLGASIVTVSEFVEYIILKIGSCFCKPQRNFEKS